MSKVAIVTDSTAYIPPEISKGYPIFSAPLQVIWDGQTLRDGIDIQPDEFYRRLATFKNNANHIAGHTLRHLLSCTAELLEEDYSILSIHISSKLIRNSRFCHSGPGHISRAPKSSWFDSESTAMAMGFQVMAVARIAAQGATLARMCRPGKPGQNHTGVLFVVNTLEFLHRGGRIGGAAAFLGTALNLKPILELRDGRIEAMERVRTMGKALDRLLDLYSERVGTKRPVHIAVLHANADEEAHKTLERACQRFETTDISESICTAISPVVGTHTGPGTIGLAFMAGM